MTEQNQQTGAGAALQAAEQVAEQAGAKVAAAVQAIEQYVKDHNGDVVAKLTAAEDYLQLHVGSEVVKLSKGAVEKFAEQLHTIWEQLPYHHNDPKA